MAEDIVETSSILDGNVSIMKADMTREMQQAAVNVTSVALGMYNMEHDIAEYIKKEFDRLYNPKWHCIVGRNFWIASDAEVVDNVAPEKNLVVASKGKYFGAHPSK